MTLIIKELIIKGEVIEDSSPFEGKKMEEEVLKEYLTQMKKEIEQDCFERLLDKLQNQTHR
ncbi:hypothetical protein SAMN00777080_4328 [Aquiflexum balticum DSM 16537]|uniref:Uncharacterized protein n=1 Tax=Aquiflexum balticum DSM 16537 TaxID=758820 RepID=A0A1W2HAD4_9BACT|nr:DUF5908 family protein [Aquiflexum balticum]SMD45668.1 hypothetical protein SAMN00777080_4328 [Aquiflexum balticum DSM 16537]